MIVPIDNQTSQTNHAGWTLAVVYRNSLETLRNLTLWTGGAVVGPSTPVTDVVLSGFQTPSTQPVSGKVFLSAQEGDAVLTGDQFLFGKNIQSLSAMSGPNNPVNNFFGSQINDENGLIDTTGTFRTRNANAEAGTNISAGRQGWDITAIDVSSKLETSQSSALFRFTSEGDLYVPNALAIQIDSLGAFLITNKAVDSNTKLVNENINYTISLENVGQLTATNIKVNDLIPEGLELVPDTIFVDGVIQPNNFPINISSIDANATKTIEYSLVAKSVPVINPAINTAKINFQFEPFAGYTVNIETKTNNVSVAIIKEDMNIIKTVDKGIALKGETLTYTSFIYNNGNLLAKNIILKDSIPTETTFVENSVSIDDVSQPGLNPENGIDIGTLDVGKVKKVSFDVVVN